MTHEELQQRFGTLMADLYACEDGAQKVELNKQYDALVVEALAFYGADASVHHTDPDLGEVFHNVYKSDVGCRPGFHTRAQAQQWLDNREDPEEDDE